MLIFQFLFTPISDTQYIGIDVSHFLTCWFQYSNKTRAVLTPDIDFCLADVCLYEGDMVGYLVLIWSYDSDTNAAQDYGGV